MSGDTVDMREPGAGGADPGSRRAGVARLLETALDHHRAGRREEADTLYAQVLDIEPEEPTGLYLRGLLAFENGAAEEAAALLGRLAELKPDRTEGWAALATVLHWLARRDEAVAAYRRVLDLNPDHAAALMGLAEVLGEAGEAEAALEAGRRAVERLPEVPAAHRALAAGLAAAGRRTEAVAAWREAVRLDPDDAGAQAALAYALLQTGDDTAALDAAERATALEEGSADAWFAQGAALGGLGRDEAAVEALQRSLDLHPRRGAVHHTLGNALVRLQRTEDAERSLLRAVELSASPARVWASLGALYRLTDRRDEAVRAYEAALADDPGLTLAHVNLAALLSEAGETERAAVHCDAAYSQANLFEDGDPKAALKVLVLVSVGQGNTPIQHLLDPARYRRIQWFVAYAQPGQAGTLPEHDVVFNAIAEPDQIGRAQAGLDIFVPLARRPVLNPPARIARTARHQTPLRLAGLDGVVTPKAIRVQAEDLEGGGLAAAVAAAGLSFPVLVRPPGSHGGEGLVKADAPAALDALPGLADGEGAYVTAFHDFRSLDGFYRKYRVIFVDRRPYPYHLAIARHWLVHHASSGMEADPARIGEEMRFLQDPEAAIGKPAMAAVAAIGRRLDLDYAGLDFSVLPDGRVLVFEANASMLVHPESPLGPFARKTPYVRAILDAFYAHLARAAVGAR